MDNDMFTRFNWERRFWYIFSITIEFIQEAKPLIGRLWIKFICLMFLCLRTHKNTWRLAHHVAPTRDYFLKILYFH